MLVIPRLLLAVLCLLSASAVTRADEAEPTPASPPAEQTPAPAPAEGGEGQSAAAPPAEASTPAEGAEQPAAPPKEIVHGSVVDLVTHQPLAGATVAVRTRNGKVLAWGKTNAAGEFDIEGSYVEHVRLPDYRDKSPGLFGQIARGAGRVFRIARHNIGRVVRPAAKAAGAAVGGAIGADVAGAVAGAVAPVPESVLPEVPDEDGPGVFIAKVVCPGYQDYQGPVQAYWMDPPDDEGDNTLDFWLDPIALAPRTDDKESKLRSGPRGEFMRLRQAALEPSIAPRNSSFTISVRLTIPPEAVEGIKVIARSDRTEEMVPLEPVAEDPGLFRGQMKVGAEWPLNDQKIILLALRSVPASADGPRSAVPEVLAEKLSLWKARKFTFDPQILASRDREELTLTVVE